MGLTNARQTRVPMPKRGRLRNDEGGDLEDCNKVTQHGSCVYFYSDVTRASILQLLTALHDANAHAIRFSSHGRIPTVHVFIHSEGGDAFAGLAGYDHLRRNPVRVVTVADGMVASAASFLLLGGRRREALPHSFVRIHQLSIRGFDGTYAALVDEVQNTHLLMNAIRDLYRDRTRLTAQRLEELLRAEIDLDVQQCIQEGIVHRVRP